MNLTVTDRAALEVKRIIEDQKLEGDAYLRVRTVGGGCSGMMNKLDLDTEFDEKKDSIFESGGIKIVVDKRSALYLEGATVDFHEDLNKRGFVVRNPSAKTTCGCGSSFSL